MTRPSPPPAPEPSNRDKMKDAVHQLLQQKAEEKASTRADEVQQKQRGKQKMRNRLLQVAALFVVLIICIVVSMPAWKQPFDPPEGQRAEQDARRAIVFAARLVDSYESRTGRLPSTFSQVGVSLPGISYMRTGDSYLLSTRANDRDLAFRKGDDAAAFLNAR
jgi:hypothetical protein